MSEAPGVARLLRLLTSVAAPVWRAKGGRMLPNIRSLAITLALASAIAVAGPTYAKGKAHVAQKAHQRHNHSGHALLGAKIHTNGPHVIDKVGKNTVTAEVK